MFDRLVRNWKTTMAALIPAMVVILGWLGLDLNPKDLFALSAGFYAIILLFSKDSKNK